MSRTSSASSATRSVLLSSLRTMWSVSNVFCSFIEVFFLSSGFSICGVLGRGVVLRRVL